MKSYDFAKQLSVMAKILKQGPNVELEDLEYSTFTNVSSPSFKIEQSDVPKALSMLVGLNGVSKAQWINLINDYEFPIELRQRDATRDIIGKLLKFLSQNEEARDRLSGKKIRKNASSSSELADALSILLS
ncbi:MAG: hypothetical protein RPR97_15570 [Colwellia sp.]|jgi:hypothetical protein